MKVLYLLCVFMVLIVHTHQYQTEIIEQSDTEVHELNNYRSRQKRAASGEYSGDCPYCSELYTTGCNRPEGNCTCVDGYYNDGKYCVQGQKFGGQMVFTDEYDAANYEGTKTNVESILESIYGNVTGYVRSTVISLKSGSTLATYQITTTASAEYADFQAALNNSLSNCNGNETEDIAGVNSNMTLDCNETAVSGLNISFLCGSQCDVNSTNCNVDKNYISCSCKDGYTNLGAFSSDDGIQYECEIIPTEPPLITSTAISCNDLWGEKMPDNTCKCMWGWDGDNCTDPWLFIFVIVTSGCVIIILGLVIGLICNAKKTKKMEKDHELNRIDFTNPFEDFQPTIMRAKVPNLYVNDYLDDSAANGANRPSVNNKSKGNEYQSAILQTGNSDPSEYF